MPFVQPMMGPMMTQGTPMAPAFATISDAPTAAASSGGVFQLEEENRKHKARIELLEKKIRAKDDLFEDALASTMAGSCACGGAGVEYKTLTAELKKRVLDLKAKHKEAEDEIERLTKTVRVVEVEVREDNEPFRNEIQRLEDQNYEF